MINDQKISALGQYIRYTLVERVKEQTGYANVEAIFGWEIAHRSDRRRKRRKIEQLIIDRNYICGLRHQRHPSFPIPANSTLNSRQHSLRSRTVALTHPRIRDDHLRLT